MTTTCPTCAALKADLRAARSALAAVREVAAKRAEVERAAASEKHLSEETA